MPPLRTRLITEALGTGLLVCTVVGSGIMATKLTKDTAVALLGNTLPTGAILVVLITMFAPISGAHFNPVVSLVMAIRRELPWPSLAPYVLVQIVGGCVGTIIAHAMFCLDLFQASTTARTGWPQWLAEFIAAFGLVLTIIGVVRTRPDMVAVAVGLYITAAYWFTASTSFANPAVTIARALSDTCRHSACHVGAFIVAQILKAFETKPDIAVIDDLLPVVSAVEVTRQIRARRRRTEVLVLAIDDSAERIEALLKAGARGYLKTLDAEDHIVEAVKSLATHKPFFTARVSEALLESFLVKPERTRLEPIALGNSAGC